MTYYANCETALRGSDGKPRTPYAYEFAWREAEHYHHSWMDYPRNEVIKMARLWAFKNIGMSVAWLEIYNEHGRPIYCKFARITKKVEEQILPNQQLKKDN